MISHVRRSPASRFLIGTEEGFIYRLQKLFPYRHFASIGGIRCPNMKKITIEAVLASLENLEPVVRVPSDLREAALASIERMIRIG